MRASHPTRRRTLPAFELAPPRARRAMIHAAARAFLPPRRTSARDGPADASLDRATEWIATDALWRLPALDDRGLASLPAAPPAAPDDVSLAVRQRCGAVHVRADPAWTDGARLVIWDRRGWTRTPHILDRTDAFALTLDAPRHGLLGIPLTGPGAALSTRVSPDGTPLALHVAVPRLTGAHRDLPAVDRREADRRVMGAIGGFDELRLRASLGYRLAETVDGPWLCPFWTYRIVARLGGRAVRIPAPAVPAVRIDLVPRSSDRAAATATRVPVGWDPPAERPRVLLSWIGERTGGLSTGRCVRDALGRSFERAGWSCRDFGDRDAIEAHWNRLAGTVLRQADFAAYVGHATASGMMFCPPDAAWLEARDCRFGGRLKWVAVDGCGPLQDDAAGSGGSAFDRWARAFCGVRSLLGFATTQEDSAEQFARAVRYALDGQPLARAWFQAACECQGIRANHGRPAWVAGLFAVDGAATTIEDRLCDAGRLPPIEMPDRLAGLWIPIG